MFAGHRETARQTRRRGGALLDDLMASRRACSVRPRQPASLVHSERRWHVVSVQRPSSRDMSCAGAASGPPYKGSGRSVNSAPMTSVDRADKGRPMVWPRVCQPAMERRGHRAACHVRSSPHPSALFRPHVCDSPSASRPVPSRQNLLQLRQRCWRFSRPRSQTGPEQR